MAEVGTCVLGDLEETRWKNGRGKTRELLTWPEDATLRGGGFLFRVSIATIEADVEFSRFPGVDRTITLLEGEEFELHHGPGHLAKRQRFGFVHGFDGEWPTTALDVRGEVRVLNVMARRGRARATIEHLAGDPRPRRFELTRPHLLLVVLDGTGSARVSNEEESLELEPDLAVWIHDPGEGEELVLDERSEDFVALLVEVRV